MVVCLVEVAGGSGSELLFGVEQFEIEIYAENGIECLLGRAGGGPYLVHRSSLVVHAEGVIVCGVNVIKSETRVVEIVHCCYRCLEGEVVYYLLHLGTVVILCLPSVLVWTKLSCIHSQEISFVPRVGYSLLDVNGNGVESGRICVDVA